MVEDWIMNQEKIMIGKLRMNKEKMALKWRINRETLMAGDTKDEIRKVDRLEVKMNYVKKVLGSWGRT